MNWGQFQKIVGPSQLLLRFFGWSEFQAMFLESGRKASQSSGSRIPGGISPKYEKQTCATIDW